MKPQKSSPILSSFSLRPILALFTIFIICMTLFILIGLIGEKVLAVSTINKETDTANTANLNTLNDNRFQLKVPGKKIDEALVNLKSANNGTSFLDEKHSQIVHDPVAVTEANGLVDQLSSDASATTLLHVLGRNDVERFLVQFRKDCNLTEIPERTIKRNIETDNYRFMVLLMPRVMLTTLVQNDCVVKVSDYNNQELFFRYAHRVLEEERRQQALRLNLKASSSDLTNYDDILDRIGSSWDKESGGAHSPLQQYVVPEDPVIIQLVKEKSSEQLYNLALSWPWVSDQKLWNLSDKWIEPEDFLSKTPEKEGSPFLGEPISDCEEHANTLVSLLLASGLSRKDVRVAIGKVKFEDGTSGGHAWAELREDGKWIVLDSTVGSYFNDEKQEPIKRDGLVFDYWRYHSFPIEKVWAYYNDKYFLDLRKKKAPSSWEQGAGNLFDDELSKSMKGSFWERLLIMIGRIIGRLF